MRISTDILLNANFAKLLEDASAREFELIEGIRPRLQPQDIYDCKAVMNPETLKSLGFRLTAKGREALDVLII